jgi:hypothetical protein
MSDDRELLERAAGVFGVPAREEGGYLYAAPAEVSTSGWGIVTWMGYGTVQFWNPLESNDDALRLAVKLHLTCRFYMGETVAQSTVPGGPSVYITDKCHRRAIVRAAAEIGSRLTG